MKQIPTTFLPLSPATLHILLSLAGEELHGYAIMSYGSPLAVSLPWK